MDRTRYLEILRELKSNVKTAKNLPDRKRPHQPIMLLIALSNLAQGRPRLQDYSSLEAGYNRLFKTYGLPDRSSHPEQPFRALYKTGLWDIPEWKNLDHGNNGTLRVGQLKQQGIKGGFRQEVHDLLNSDKAVLFKSISMLLDDFFPWILHEDILNELNLENASGGIDLSHDSSQFALYKRRIRDPRFGKKVLQAYRHQCAICKYRLTIGGMGFGLEAAHIKTYCHEGPNRPDNGLALCTLHHKAFDIGAIGLEQSEESYCVLVSPQVQGDQTSMRVLTDYQGHQIARPAQDSLAPNPMYVNWHRGAVFRG